MGADRGPFHEGERKVQERAGTAAMSARTGGAIHAAIPPAAAEFLAGRRVAWVTSTDERGRPWISPVVGAPGFLESPDPRTLRIRLSPAPGDLLVRNLPTSPFLGILVADLATRRRARFNGSRGEMAGGVLSIGIDQAYGNCPKYIQRRIDAAGKTHPAWELLPAGPGEEHRSRIGRADTFFVGTVHPGSGADASHRGGMPGFVRLEGDRLVWPEYAGNLMFNTLGNVAVFPRAGLAFPDFERGDVLHLTGRAAIDWDPAGVPGAERLVRFETESAVESRGVLPPGARLLEPSPFNPEPPSRWRGGGAGC